MKMLYQGNYIRVSLLGLHLGGRLSNVEKLSGFIEFRAG